MIKKQIIALTTGAAGVLLSISPALAHVVVRPAEVGVGQRQNFTVSVPTEEETPTISVRLVLPEGLQSVRPNTKPGWNIELKKTGEGEEAKVSEIIWTGGRIPAEQRDEFVFSAQAPAQGSILVWKAYQTYGNGDVVAWDASPEAVAEYSKNNPPAEGADHDHDAPKPYSETKVINDLENSSTNSTQTSKSGDSKDQSQNSTFALSLGAVAFLMAGASLWMQTKKGKK